MGAGRSRTSSSASGTNPVATSRRVTSTSQGRTVGCGHQPGHDVGRGVVHPVRVVEHEHGRVGQRRLQVAQHDLLDLGPAEALLEPSGRRGLRQRQVQRDAQQRHQRDQLGVAAGHLRREALEHLLRRGTRGQGGHLAQQQPHRVVRRRGLVLLAGGLQEAQVRTAPVQLGDEPGLADARLAGEVDDDAAPGPDLCRCRVQLGQLGLPADQRQVVGVLARLPQHRPDAGGVDRLRLALDGERRQLLALEPVLDAASTAAVASSCPGAALDITRAARFTASPLIEYVRRNAGPKSPANTPPLLTPIRSGSAPGRSRTRRQASSIRSSLEPPLVGAPATSMILPPSASMSVSKNVTPCRSQASCTLRTTASSASVSASTPASASSASVPENRTNATATRRCSGSAAPSMT